MSLCHATLVMTVGREDAQRPSSWSHLHLEAQKKEVTGQCSSHGLPDQVLTNVSIPTLVATDVAVIATGRHPFCFLVTPKPPTQSQIDRELIETSKPVLTQGTCRGASVQPSVLWTTAASPGVVQCLACTLHAQLHAQLHKCMHNCMHNCTTAQLHTQLHIQLHAQLHAQLHTAACPLSCHIWQP